MMTATITKMPTPSKPPVSSDCGRFILSHEQGKGYIVTDENGYQVACAPTETDLLLQACERGITFFEFAAR